MLDCATAEQAVLPASLPACGMYGPGPREMDRPTRLMAAGCAANSHAAPVPRAVQAELPYLLVQVCLFCCVSYWMIGE